ncbi:OmpA family protein [Virgibacillus kimchii]
MRWGKAVSGKSLVLAAVMFVLAACSEDESVVIEEDGDEASAEEINEIDENKTKQAEEEVEETNSPLDELGDLEVQLTGEVMVDEDQIIIEGNSNLLPGSRIFSSGVTDGGFASITFQDAATIEDDGTFSFIFDGISQSTTVKLSLNTGNDQTKEHYGENLEKVTGPQVYVTDTHGEFTVKAEFYIDVDLQMPYTIPIEIPDWSEKPDDYGETEIWMEADVDSDHRYLYFTGKSNLLEGTQVGGNLRKASGIIDAFSFGFTRVNPDGTFELRVPYHKLHQGMYMPIRVEPGRNSWDDVVDVYGENGEQFEGDLVVEDEGEKYVELIMEVEAPDFEPPEDVGLTVDDEEVKINMPDDLLFDFDESELKEDAIEVLDELLEDLQSLEAETQIEINGHTDNVGDPDYNLELSQERADAVWAYLQENGDVSNLNATIEGYGETDPIATNKNEEGQERNRRVEIVINPK